MKNLAKDAHEDNDGFVLITLFIIICALAFLLTGCTADGSFDGQSFGAVTNALTGTYRAYEDEQRWNRYPQTAPIPAP